MEPTEVTFWIVAVLGLIALVALVVNLRRHRPENLDGDDKRFDR